MHNSFQDWAKHVLVRVWIAIASTIGAFITISTHLSKLLSEMGIDPKLHSDSGLLSIISYGFQCLMVLVLYLVSLRRPAVDETSEAKRQASDAVRNFHSYWCLLWFSWLLLYGLLTFLAFLKLKSPDLVNSGILSPWVDIILNAVNNFGSVALLSAYLLLSKPSKALHSKPFFQYLVGLLVLVALIEFLLKWGVTKPTSPAEPHPMDWVMAIVGATAMALLIGRLDSKVIQPKSWVIIILYVYSSIQVLWPYLMNHEAFRLVMTTLALAFKWVFFLYIHWLLTSGMLLYYMLEIQALNEKAARLRDEFFDKLLSPTEWEAQLSNVDRFWNLLKQAYKSYQTEQPAAPASVRTMAHNASAFPGIPVMAGQKLAAIANEVQLAPQSPETHLWTFCRKVYPQFIPPTPGVTPLPLEQRSILGKENFDEFERIHDDLATFWNKWGRATVQDKVISVERLHELFRDQKDLIKFLSYLDPAHFSCKNKDGDGRRWLFELAAKPVSVT